MANSPLENFRSLHAIIELCKEQMHDDLVDGARGKKEQVLQDHRNKQRIDKIVECTKKLMPLYEDKDHKFRDELENTRQRGHIHEFYSRFTEIRRNHEQNSNIPVVSDQITFEPDVQFSGEEWNGRFIDFHEFFEKYLNLAVFKSSSKVLQKMDVLDPLTNKMKTKTETRKIDYKTFITRVFEFWRIENNKKNKQYIKFYEELLEYLVGFWKRTHPITPTKAILKKCETVFEDDWKDGAVEGWQKPWSKATKQKFSKSVSLLSDLKLSQQKQKESKDKEESVSNGKDEASDKQKKQSNDKMEEDDDSNDGNESGDKVANGKHKNSSKEEADDDDDGDDDIDMKERNNDKHGDNAKQADNNEQDEDEDMDISLSLKYNHGLYCFACVRKFNNLNTLVNGHYKSKKHLAKKQIALLEYKVSLFADLLSDAILGAVEYIEKKQTKTYDEIRLELEEAEKEDEYEYDDEGKLSRKRAGAGGYDSDDMEDDPSILNPLQIPLDFDGKPIPYWLYKFRGLNRYFECEICDTRYRGPRAFERHFREWKHAHCMRILNIPNTKDFHMITTRQDAELLNQKIQQAKMTKSWDAEREEEFEDNDGNVFKKSMYDQLKKQGVI